MMTATKLTKFGQIIQTTSSCFVMNRNNVGNIRILLKMLFQLNQIHRLMPLCGNSFHRFTVSRNHTSHTFAIDTISHNYCFTLTGTSDESIASTAQVPEPVNKIAS